MECTCRWLASNGQPAAAEQALRSLRGPEDVEADVAEMQQAAEAESKLQSWTLLRSPVVRAELQLGESQCLLVEAAAAGGGAPCCNTALVLAAAAAGSVPALCGESGCWC